MSTPTKKFVQKNRIPKQLLDVRGGLTSLDYTKIQLWEAITEQVVLSSSLPLKMWRGAPDRNYELGFGAQAVDVLSVSRSVLGKLGLLCVSGDRGRTHSEGEGTGDG
jgi:hypothetical protein